MFDLEKCILITNNDRAAAEWKEKIGRIILLKTYEEVLTTTRDLLHTGCRLLTHPQASSLKPNQTPYRSILLYGEGEGKCAEAVSRKDICVEDILRIESAIEAFHKWNDIKTIPQYDEKTADDYKTIDLSMLEHVLPRL